MFRHLVTTALSEPVGNTWRIWRRKPLINLVLLLKKNLLVLSILLSYQIFLLAAGGDELESLLQHVCFIATG